MATENATMTIMQSTAEKPDVRVRKAPKCPNISRTTAGDGEKDVLGWLGAFLDAIADAVAAIAKRSKA
jgi:hypothetical protein